MRLSSKLLLQFLFSSSLYTLVVEGSFGFGPLGKWKVENANSYIIFNGIYIPNPEEMIDPGSILDSLNPVSGFNDFWRTVPSFGGFFGGGDESDEFAADPSTMSASYANPEGASSEPASSILSPDDSSSGGGWFGFGGSSPFSSSDPSSPLSVDDSGDGSSSGFSSYLPWNWFSGNSRSGDPPPNYAALGANNQLPPEFAFLMNRRMDENPELERAHELEQRAKEKVSVYYRPIGQGSFLRYEVHEPLEGATAAGTNGKSPNLAQTTSTTDTKAATPGKMTRKKRSAINNDEDDKNQLKKKRVSKQYIPRSLRNPITQEQKQEAQTSASKDSSIKKKSGVQYNRRRYQQLQKQKKHLTPSASSSRRRSALLAKLQKNRKSDDATPAVQDMSADFPCPKVGLWSYNGEVCIALGPVPKWACKPIDLVASGKLVVCRNKILMPSSVSSSPSASPST